MWHSIGLAAYIVGANALPWLLVHHLAVKIERDANRRRSLASASSKPS